MKTIRFPVCLAMTISLAALSNAGCAEKDKAADTPAPPAKETPVAAAETPDADAARWSEIKDLAYGNRVAFMAGFKRLQARLDEQTSGLVAQRAAMKDDANTKDWDFAMKELGNARAYLTGTGEIIGKATSESWAQDKERVGQAWVRAQNACAKVKASTTQ